MLSKIKQIGFLGLLLFSTMVKAQANLEDLEKINQTYKTSSGYHFDLRYSLFKDYQTAVETEGFNMSVSANNKDYYCKRSDNEVLLNEHYALVVDHDNKVILIENARKNERKKNQKMEWKELDTLLQKMSEVLKKDIDKIAGEQEIEAIQNKMSESENQYVFNYSTGEYTRVVLSYHPSTFHIKKVTMYYREKMQLKDGETRATPRIEITYVDTDLNPEFDKKLFSERKYVHVKKDGKLELTAALQNYKVINHLGKQ
ncbi:MAG TPA: hypothetical protein VLB84_00025 [Bacteroidia bacterium]|nr:hypothetical protein [Bacteroidia bacterium]